MSKSRKDITVLQNARKNIADDTRQDLPYSLREWFTRKQRKSIAEVHLKVYFGFPPQQPHSNIIFR